MKLQDLAPVAIIIVVAGIAIGIGAEVLEEIKGDITENSTGYYAVGNTTEGIGKLADWLPIIGLVVAAAIVIGVVFWSFARGKV